MKSTTEPSSQDELRQWLRPYVYLQPPLGNKHSSAFYDALAITNEQRLNQVMEIINRHYTPKTEQQPVGGEDELRKFAVTIGNQWNSDHDGYNQCFTNRMCNKCTHIFDLISRHYIAKEAVAAEYQRGYNTGWQKANRNSNGKRFVTVAKELRAMADRLDRLNLNPNPSQEDSDV